MLTPRLLADRRRDWLLVALLVLLGLAPRAAAVGFNLWPHGDVVLDSAIADSVALQGRLLVPIVDVRFYPIERFGFGYPPDQHPPLWPLLGAIGRLALGDSYLALRLWSLLAGLALVPAVYLCGRGLVGRGAALLAAALCAASYLLVDFAGNGSLWSLLALLYVLFVWRLSRVAPGHSGEAMVVGLLMGVSYLVNYPAAILPAAFAATLGLRWWAERRGSAVSTVKERQARGGWLRVLAVGLASSLVVVLPWLAFNTVTYGNPVFSQPLQRQLGGSDKRVDVLVTGAGVVKRPAGAGGGLPATVRRVAGDLYGNVGFVLRQSFVVVPLFGQLALAAGLVLGWRLLRGRAAPFAGLLVLAATHLALVLLWPTTKFRYLVPLLPLAALLGSWCLSQLRPLDLRATLVVLTIGLTVITSVWTFRSLPSRTYYYDGGVVTDNFGSQGETAWFEEVRRVAQAAAVLRTSPPGPLLGAHPFYHLAPGYPLLINSPDYSREVVERLVQRYGVRYVWSEQGRQPFYAAFLRVETLWQDDRFVLLRIAPNA
ncbi:MAG: glycosyltransferase family 39 protein [Chloroflexi bacterium]|nr:glycosyltransferase family 39 protein [Chloroflexota bacterium]